MIVDILATAEQISKRKFPANAVAYTDRTTGAKVLLMPSFSDGIDARRINEANTQTFRSLGYEVVPVESMAFERYGGIHCLINILQ